MAAGADSIDDMGLLRHGAMQTLFGGVRATAATTWPHVTYHPQDKRVGAEARPETIMYVGACPRPELHLTYMIDIAMTTEFALDVASGAR